MRKIITAILMIAGLLLGGFVSSVPAQADVEADFQSVAPQYTIQDVLPQSDAEPMISGSSIFFDTIQTGIPLTIDLHNTSVTGYQYLQSYGTIRNNVAKTCPKSDDFKLMFIDAQGSWHYLEPGQCYRPGRTGRISVGIFRASYPS